MLINKKTIIYLLLCLSIFLGFFFEENSSGGAKLDYLYLLPFIEGFKIDFITGLNFFLSDTGSIIHSPVFYLLVGKQGVSHGGSLNNMQSHSSMHGSSHGSSHSSSHVRSVDPRVPRF